MIKVRLKPEQGIKVKLTPKMATGVDIKKVYLYDPDWIPEINKAVIESKTSELNAKESELKAKESETLAKGYEQSAKESKDIAVESKNTAVESAELSVESSRRAKESEVVATGSAGVASESMGKALESEQKAKESETKSYSYSESARASAEEAKRIRETLGSVYEFKGSVATISDLPTEGVKVGDVYDVLDSGTNYAWAGDRWDSLGASFDLSEYIKDVQANGTSIVKEGVANIPIATSSTLGLVRPVPANGITVSSTGTLNLSKLSNASLVNKTSNYAVLVSQIDLATKVGVTTNTIELTDEEKENARNWIGALKKTQVGSDLSYEDSKLQLIDQDGKPIGSAVEIKASGGGSNDLFDHKWSDHILNDISWLRADTFSWQSGEVYKSAYEHLVEDFNGTTSATETIGSQTITYYQAEDGHKIVLPDMEATVQAIYNETGVAWYYILDVANKRFKLPRELPITDKSKGNGMTLGFQTGDTDLGLLGASGTSGTYLSASTAAYGKSFPGTYSGGDRFSNNEAIGITTDPTKSGIISHRENENGQQYLYFYVGNYTKSAIEQTAGITTEVLNDKLDTELGNATATTKETIVGWGIPDYSAVVSISETSYTATYRCLVCATAYNKYIYVNGNRIAYGASNVNAQIVLDVGDTITGADSSSIDVYPLKGIQNA